MNITLFLGTSALSFLAVLSSSWAESADSAWSASWIGLPRNVVASGEATEESRTPANTWCCFRGRIQLDAPPQQANARIACDSKYWLWVNDELVVFEGQLKRGPNPEDTYFDRVDLKEYLQEGDNLIAILVWHFGKEGMSHKNSGKLGLVFEADCDGKQFLSNRSWKAKLHPAYGNTEKPHPNWRLPESNIRFDASQDIADWQSSEHNDSDWAFAEEFGPPPEAPWNQLVERSIPQWRRTDVRPYEEVQEIEENTTRVLVGKLPYNAQITPYLKVEAPAGKLIGIRTDNYRGGSEPNVRSEYITKQGTQEYESLGWMNGHEVRYQIPDGVKVIELGYRESGYDCDLAGSFECDDPFLNRLWNKSYRTLYVNMRDGFFDCPGRERAQWWGDVTLEIPQTFYSMDTASHLLGRKAILELVDWHKEDGTLFSPIPAGNWDKELPMQMLASVGRYGFWTYYLHTGDRETIEHVYPTVQNYVLSVWQLGEDGLVVPRKGAWMWGDWGKNKDMPLLYNAWYYLALDSVASMAKLLGHEDDLQEAQSRMASIEEQFNKRFWNGKEYRSPQYEGPTDDRGQALAVVSGLAKSDQFSQIRNVLREQSHASPYMEKYVLQALFEMGFYEDAYQRMAKRYHKMVESDLTTLWEGWGIGTEGFGGGSYNHAWSGGPLILLSKYAAGIFPLEPEYKSFGVRPKLGPLKHVEAEVSTVAGVVRVTATQSESKFSLTVDVPNSTTAELSVPKQFAGSLSINGQQIEPVMPDSIEGLESIRDEEDELVIVVTEGRWQVDAVRVSAPAE